MLKPPYAEPTRTVTLFGRIPPEALTYWLLNFGAHGPYEVTHAFGPYWSAFSKDASIRASLPPRLLSIAAGVKNEPAGNRADDQAMHFEMVFAYIMTDRFAKALNAFVQGHPQLKEKIGALSVNAAGLWLTVVGRADVLRSRSHLEALASSSLLAILGPCRRSQSLQSRRKVLSRPSFAVSFPILLLLTDFWNRLLVAHPRLRVAAPSSHANVRSLAPNSRPSRP